MMGTPLEKQNTKTCRNELLGLKPKTKLELDAQLTSGLRSAASHFVHEEAEDA